MNRIKHLRSGKSVPKSKSVRDKVIAIAIVIFIILLLIFSALMSHMTTH